MHNFYISSSAFKMSSDPVSRFFWGTFLQQTSEKHNNMGFFFFSGRGRRELWLPQMTGNRNWGYSFSEYFYRAVLHFKLQFECFLLTRITIFQDAKFRLTPTARHSFSNSEIYGPGFLHATLSSTW